MRRFALTLGVAAAGIAVIGTLPGAALAGPTRVLRAVPQAAPVTSALNLVHAIPGVAGNPVEFVVTNLGTHVQGVYAAKFTFTGLVPEPAGVFRVAVRPAGGGATLLTKDVVLAPKQQVTVAAHLTATGAARLTAFWDDLRPVAPGRARLTVRHLAQAPAVDVIANGVTVVDALTNAKQVSLVVPARTYALRLRADRGGARWFAATLTVGAGKDTVVYALGSRPGGTFTAVTQVLALRP